MKCIEKPDLKCSLMWGVAVDAEDALSECKKLLNSSILFHSIGKVGDDLNVVSCIAALRVYTVDAGSVVGSKGAAFGGFAIIKHYAKVFAYFRQRDVLWLYLVNYAFRNRPAERGLVHSHLRIGSVKRLMTAYANLNVSSVVSHVLVEIRGQGFNLLAFIALLRKDRHIRDLTSGCRPTYLCKFL